LKLFFDHDVPGHLSFLLRSLDHEGTFLRQVLPIETEDSRILQFAFNHQMLLLTCNRRDFLKLAETQEHCGIILVIRRETRVAERSALLHLLQQAGESGLIGNINFA
jgi:predicted nuclease of predicted toxin-antitoxin system